MTTTFAVDKNNDIFIGQDGRLSIASDLAATMQAAEQAAKTQIGELQYATDVGIPNFQITWNGAPNLIQLDAHIRRAILSVEHVVSIKELKITRQGSAAVYSAVIITDYGQGQISG